MAVGYCRPQSIYVFVILKLPMGRITADLLFLVHFLTIATPYTTWP